MWARPVKTGSHATTGCIASSKQEAFRNACDLNRGCNRWQRHVAIQHTKVKDMIETEKEMIQNPQKDPAYLLTSVLWTPFCEFPSLSPGEFML